MQQRTQQHLPEKSRLNQALETSVDDRLKVHNVLYTADGHLPPTSPPPPQKKATQLKASN